MFGAGVHFRNQLYDTRRLQVNELRGPVVSVGNISVGGAGKTPFTILLGEQLKQRGIPFDILSRGYGRVSKSVAVVDPAGLPQEFGDEPLLMARRLGAQVVVGASRYEAGLLAEKKWGPRLHLLDDGFQHRKLARQFDIALVTADDVRDVLLPAGRLREPMASLARADVMVATTDITLGLLPSPVQRLWYVTRTLQLQHVPEHPVAVCAIARPQVFISQLRANGVDPAAELAFRDHHRYTEADIHRLLRLAKSHHADGFITTEKDAVNLGSLAEQLSPLSVAILKTELHDADAALQNMLDTLRERGKPAA